MKNVITLLAASLLTLSTLFSNDVEMRLSPALYDGDHDELFVTIEMKKNDSGKFFLGGQNYRLYFNASVLELDASSVETNLPQETYGEVNLVDMVNGVSALGSNNLGFEDELSFVNFSVQLKDNLHGGIAVERNDGWVTVATMKFDVVSKNESAQVVWGREGYTDDLATAFAEIAEWVAPSTTEVAEINFSDLNFAFPNENQLEETTVQIGPNPTSDYLHVSLPNAISEDAQILMYAMNGASVLTESIQIGANRTTIDVSDLAKGTYMVFITDNSEGIITKEKIVIAN